MHDESLYYVMEYIAGTTSEELLKTVHPGGIPSDIVLKIGIQISEALCAAEACDIIHRDIKPSNILLLDGKADSSDRVKLIDFGLAKSLSTRRDEDVFVSEPNTFTPSPPPLPARSRLIKKAPSISAATSMHSGSPCGGCGPVPLPSRKPISTCSAISTSRRFSH